jgi:hypothetical protein
MQQTFYRRDAEDAETNKFKKEILGDLCVSAVKIFYP